LDLGFWEEGSGGSEIPIKHNKEALELFPGDWLSYDITGERFEKFK
jgi:hypothetical protein